MSAATSPPVGPRPTLGPEHPYVAALLNKNEAIPYRVVPYLPVFRQIAGSFSAAILLRQMLHWHYWSGVGKTFYKFKEPAPRHPWYHQDGDSWTEELGFSVDEFDAALKKIGTKITKGVSKSDARAKTDATGVVIFWIDSSRVTWYEVNVALLDRLLNEAHQALGKPEDPRYLSKREDPGFPIDGKIPDTFLTKKTSKKTSKKTEEKEMASTTSTPRENLFLLEASSSESEPPIAANPPSGPRKRIPLAKRGRLTEESAPADYHVTENYRPHWRGFVRWYYDEYPRQKKPRRAWEEFRRQFRDLTGKELAAALADLTAATQQFHRQMIMEDREAPFIPHPNKFLDEDWYYHLRDDPPPEPTGSPADIAF